MERYKSVYAQRYAAYSNYKISRRYSQFHDEVSLVIYLSFGGLTTRFCKN